jgi:hypothetical protein
MAILGGIARGVGRGAMELGKVAVRAAEKVGKAASDSSKESSSLKGTTHGFNPLRNFVREHGHMHEHGHEHEKSKNFINDSFEPISFKGKNGSLNVDKLTFQKVGDIVRNEVKFGQDIAHTRENGREDLAMHNKVEKFAKEVGELLRKIEHHIGKDRLVKEIHSSLDNDSNTGKFSQDEKKSLEDGKDSKEKLTEAIHELMENKSPNVKDFLEQGKKLLEKLDQDKSIDILPQEMDELKSKLEEMRKLDKFSYEKDNKPINTKDRNDDNRLYRAFSSARSNSMQNLKDSYGVEKSQSNGTRNVKHHHLNVYSGKVVHGPSEPINVEKSTLRLKQELNKMFSKDHHNFSSLNSHQGNFNQQLRQFDPGGEIVERLANAAGVYTLPLSEDGSTQQNTNGTSSVGDKLEEKLSNKGEEHKASDESYQSQRKAMESESHMLKSVK